MTCPSCSEPVDPAARFCEACGTALEPVAAAPVAEDLDRTVKAPPPEPPVMVACTSCGSTGGFDESGYCVACGHLGASPRDHMVLLIASVAGVSDKGPKKPRNEDSMALVDLTGGGFALSVCDGVSNIPRSADASQAACDAAVMILATLPDAADRPPTVFAAAHQQALQKVIGLASSTPDGTEPPSCTYLAAAWRPGEPLRVGWAGDCRAYFIGVTGVARLTVDHSWGTEQVNGGVLTQEQADADDRSHSITRWLGADAPEQPADFVEVDVSGGGLALFCSDGLWNYLTDASLAGLLAAGRAGEQPVELGERLVAHAIAGGGHDNITVVVAPIPSLKGKA